jgi:hypothetical protein
MDRACGAAAGSEALVAPPGEPARRRVGQRCGWRCAVLELRRPAQVCQHRGRGGGARCGCCPSVTEQEREDAGAALRRGAGAVASGPAGRRACFGTPRRRARRATHRPLRRGRALSLQDARRRGALRFQGDQPAGPGRGSLCVELRATAASSTLSGARHAPTRRAAPQSIVAAQRPRPRPAVCAHAPRRAAAASNAAHTLSASRRAAPGRGLHARIRGAAARPRVAPGLVSASACRRGRRAPAAPARPRYRRAGQTWWLVSGSRAHHEVHRGRCGAGAAQACGDGGGARRRQQPVR